MRTEEELQKGAMEIVHIVKNILPEWSEDKILQNQDFITGFLTEFHQANSPCFSYGDTA